MTAKPPRGGKTGKSVSPKRTLHKDKAPPPMWAEFLKDVKKFREDAGLTVAEVADILGVTTAKILIWERGTSTPHPHDLCVYLAAIGAKRLRVE